MLNSIFWMASCKYGTFLVFLDNGLSPSCETEFFVYNLIHFVPFVFVG
uniref:Uncharacterized protein n=1 Tax=Arundo donax TaxID=35708 RepID=A0A0A9BFN8_ARUDO